MDFQFKDKYTFDDLLEIMKILRSENGCPWDREQDHKSIRNDFLEEAYEAVEAIDNGNKELLCEELGDVLLQVVFHSRIAEDDGDFGIDEVVDGISKKLIVRHPHVFGDTKVENSNDVLVNWANIKYDTKDYKSTYEKLDGVSKALPSLTRAGKLIKRAKEADALEDGHFTLTLENDALTKYGRELFEIVSRAKAEKVDPEEALSKYNDAFLDTFKD